MEIKCGKYKHFKGNCYTVFGIVCNHKNEEFVLYQKDYDDKTFWIRPVPMFIEEIDVNGRKIQRFSLEDEISHEEAIAKLSNILKGQSIAISHSECEDKYKIFNISSKSKTIRIIPYELYSSYLTDTQMAWRMGYDFYKIDDEKFIQSTAIEPSNNKKLTIDIESDLDREYENKKIIENINPCSIDLHISDHFFSRAKCKTVDIASMMHFSVKASDLWKEIYPKKINGFDGIVMKPGQTIITHTLEKIELPSDCAGKIEIKSTYARLALTVTASDFCNPGWKGYFPLAISNHSKHTIILHPKEKMLQLSLVQTDGYIINEYSQNATYMNDDGTPYKFWHAQTIKHLQKEHFSDKILDFYQKVQASINVNNSDNPDETKKRFEDSFLPFCERKLKSKKYNSIRDSKALLKKIWVMYRGKEYIKKFLLGRFFKTLSFIIAFIPTIIVACIELFVNKQLDRSLFIVFGLSLLFAITIEIVLHILTPKCFCTFEKLEFDNIYQNKHP